MTRSLLFVAAVATFAIASDARSDAQAPSVLAPSEGRIAVTRDALGGPRFKGGVDLVTLDVCVKDAAGRSLPDLTPEDFLVLENGKPQRPSFVLPSGTLPLRAMLLIDRSASMNGDKLARAIDAATMFARSLESHDTLGIITFNQQAERIHAFGDDPSRAPASLGSLTATGTTSLYDALLVAANELARARNHALPDTREAVIVLSDGEDTASHVGFEEVLPVLRRTGALVYSISLRTDRKGTWLGATWPLLAMARDTGGRALGVPTLAALPALYAEIDAEMRHLYRIGYVSADERHDGQWRDVSVRVISRDAKVRTRAGYYAAGQRKGYSQ